MAGSRFQIDHSSPGALRVKPGNRFNQAIVVPFHPIAKQESSRASAGRLQPGLEDRMCSARVALGQRRRVEGRGIASAISNALKTNGSDSRPRPSPIYKRWVIAGAGRAACS